MPPPIPDRFRLEVRLGRDTDIEEWLATDTVLDRPVLVDILGPDSSPDRRSAFLQAFREAASVTHNHLCAVYAAGALDQGAYAVVEWPGGVTLDHRLRAGETMPVEEFLPNAAGVASALAALHERGNLHGSVSPGAIFYTYAHPAKLGAFGRPASYRRPGEEVAALGAALETSLVGNTVAGASPSQMTDGLPSAVDGVLASAKTGGLDAAQLASDLRAIRSAPPPEIRPGWSWRWLLPASVLVGLAVAITSLGLILRAPPGSDFLFPAVPSASSPPAGSTTVPVTSTAPTPEIEVSRAFAYDPFGDGSERDDDIPQALDGDPDTAWRTERYFGPLSDLKRGVGLGFEVQGTPAELDFSATEGTAYSLYWAEEVPEDFQGWTRLAAGNASRAGTRLQLPSRQGGTWLIWLEELPAQENDYYAEVAEVRFLP